MHIQLNSHALIGLSIKYPKKISNTSQCRHWFLREIKSKEWTQIFLTNVWRVTIQIWVSTTDWLAYWRHVATHENWARPLIGGKFLQPIRSTIHFSWVVTCHKYGISALVTLGHFSGKPLAVSRNDGCSVFSQAGYKGMLGLTYIL